MKKNKKQKAIFKPLIFILLLVGVAVLLYYSVLEYQGQSEATGITICNEGECIKTLHIHSDITFDLCGRSTTLPREDGELAGLHTHKEKNYLHFHERVKVDPDSKEQRFDKRLSLQEVLEMFELSPAEYCSGPGPFEVIFTVNGGLPDAGLDYNWQDGDDLHLIFKASP